MKKKKREEKKHNKRNYSDSFSFFFKVQSTKENRRLSSSINSGKNTSVKTPTISYLLIERTGETRRSGTYFNTLNTFVLLTIEVNSTHTHTNDRFSFLRCLLVFFLKKSSHSSFSLFFFVFLRASFVS